jgi:hypothetical protein
MQQKQNIISNSEAVSILEHLAHGKTFGEAEWNQFTLAADCWLNAQRYSLPRPPVYSALKQLLEKFSAEIGNFLKNCSGPTEKYREFVLFHTRNWKIFCLLTEVPPTSAKDKNFSSNINLWNRKIEKSLERIRSQNGKTTQIMEDFDEYANCWTQVMIAESQPVATYSMTKYIRDHSLDSLLNHLAERAIQAEQHPADRIRYHRIYLYVHFHLRNWRQFTQLKKIPRP